MLATARESDGRAEVPACAPADSLSDWSSVASLAINDFEAVVAARHPSIAAIVKQLRGLGCSPALMSGSGSSVFGVLPGAGGVEMPRFTDASSEPAPRVLLTRSAIGVAPVVVSTE